MARDIRPVQLALHLPGTDDELDNALGFDLDAWHQAFVSAVVRGASGSEAVREADALTGKPARSATAASTKAHKLLTHQGSRSNGIALAIANRRRRLASSSRWTEDEWWAALRYARDVAIGEQQIRKTLVKTYDGQTHLEDVMVYDPSLSAATKTLEIAGRCLQLLGADGATIEPGQDGSVTVRFIGLRPGEDEPAADDEAAAQE